MISVDVSDFRSHDQLASRCGLAPATQQSGTSIHYDKAQRSGNKQPENPLVFSCNSLARSKGRYGRYMRRCLARGMTHHSALKATTRKRLKAIYAVMRDGVPYAEEPAGRVPAPLG